MSQPGSTPLDVILAQNEQLTQRRETVTAVFTGATRGIGFGTLQAFLKHIPRPKAIIVGRSRAKFAPELEALQSLNPQAELIFIEAQLSLIKEVDRVCEELQQRLSPHSVDLFFTSQGYAPFGDRKNTSEGIDDFLALVYYWKMRMIERLIFNGVLAKEARIVFVGGGNKEGPMIEQDLELKDNWSLFKLRGHLTSMITLSCDWLSHKYPDLGIVHVFPGNVATDLMTPDGGTSVLFGVLIGVLRRVLKLFAITPRECGERMLWVGTVERFQKGCFSIDYDGTASQSQALAEYRKDPKWASTVWEHLEELFKRAYSTSA